MVGGNLREGAGEQGMNPPFLQVLEGDGEVVHHKVVVLRILQTPEVPQGPHTDVGTDKDGHYLAAIVMRKDVAAPASYRCVNIVHTFFGLLKHASASSDPPPSSPAAIAPSPALLYDMRVAEIANSDPRTARKTREGIMRTGA